MDYSKWDAVGDSDSDSDDARPPQPPGGQPSRAEDEAQLRGMMSGGFGNGPPGSGPDDGRATIEELPDAPEPPPAKLAPNSTEALLQEHAPLPKDPSLDYKPGDYKNDEFTRKMDPYEFCRGEQMWKTLARHPATQKYLADSEFIRKMTEMQADPILGMRRALDDPRVTQALMVLQGGGSSIKITDDDMKEAERKGHIKKPDALQLPEIQKAYKCKDCYECKDLGNSHFKKGETNQALAYYDRGLQLIAEGTEKELSCSLLSNTAMGMLKLKHFAKAEQACNDAMRLIGEKTSAYSEIRAKLYHRRAMAREKLKKWDTAVQDMHSCVYQGKKAGLGSKEMAKLNAEVKRLTKLSALKQKAAEDVLKAEIEEDRVADKRMQGAALGYEVEKQATAATAAPGASIGYMSEKDYTFWANARLKKVLEGAQLSLDSGGRIKVHEYNEKGSDLEASVTVKHGHKSLYYNMDVHCGWTGTSKLGAGGEYQGIVRIYNVSHETSFNLGGDAGTCYLYQLGWSSESQQHDGEDWAEEIRARAHDLFDLVADRIDVVVKELKQK